MNKCLSLDLMASVFDWIYMTLRVENPVWGNVPPAKPFIAEILLL